jgi:putative transposase
MQAEAKDVYWAIFETGDLTTPPGPDPVAIIDARIDAFADKYRALCPAAIGILLTDRAA